jgi:hypothetical protein
MSTNHVLSLEYQRFLEHAVTQGKCLSPLPLLDDGLPLLVRTYESALNSWPVFISPEQKHRLADCGVSMPLLLPKVFAAAFDSDPDAVSEYYGIPLPFAQRMIDAVAKADIASTLITRSDVVMSEEGLRTVEVNLGGIGGWLIQLLDVQYRKQPELGEFIDTLDHCESRDILREFYIHLMGTCRARPGAVDRKIVWMFVFPRVFFFEEGHRTYGDMLAAFAAEDGIELEVLFATDMEATRIEDGYLMHGDSIVDALLVGPRSVKVEAGVLDAFDCGKLVWLSNPYNQVLGDKRNLALLSRFRNSPHLSDNDRRTIEDYLPWCVVASPGMVEFDGREVELRQLLLEHQDRFVIKHAHGAKGEDVHVGIYAGAGVF